MNEPEIENGSKPTMKLFENKNIEVVEILSSDDEKEKNYNEMEKRRESINKELGAT